MAEIWELSRLWQHLATLPWSLILPQPLFVPTLARQQAKPAAALANFPWILKEWSTDLLDSVEACIIQSFEQHRPTGINTILKLSNLKTWKQALLIAQGFRETAASIHPPI